MQLELDSLDDVALYYAHAREVYEDIGSFVDTVETGLESLPAILTGGKGILAPHAVAPTGKWAVRGIACHVCRRVNVSNRLVLVTRSSPPSFFPRRACGLGSVLVAWVD